MLLAAVEIPKMFTAYAEDLGYMENGLHKYQYYCDECGQSFMAAWGRKPGTYPAVEFGSWFTCPECRKMHHENVIYIPQGEETPEKVRLTVNEFKNVVTFAVTCQTIKFDGDMRVVRRRGYKETFRVDIAKQTVTFSRVSDGSENKTFEIGNPFSLEILNTSILCYFQSFSLGNSKQKKELIKILKKFREVVHHKLEKHLGYKVKSMYVSQGQYHGSFLLPIFNIAFRVSCPDAPNLPAAYRERVEDIQTFWYKNLIEKYDFMKNVIAQTRNNTSFVKAIASEHELPDKPLIRRLLIENPFGVKLIAKSFELCENYDCAISLYNGLTELSRIGDSESFFNFLRAMKCIYGESGVIRLANGEKSLNLWDCKRLYEQLSDENKELIKTEGVSLVDLHDWMSMKHKMQTHKNMNFEVPEHIIKRLSMQKHRLEFFMPKESMELLIAGHELHNCVASYGQAMKDNSRWIVLVADDSGKLVACLEIKENMLVQAKLNRNIPVAKDTELNNAILEWAKATNLKINTSDIKEYVKNKNKVTVPA